MGRLELTSIAHRASHILGSAALAAGLALAAPADGQERYELTQQGWAQAEPPAPGSPEAALQEIRRLVAEARFDRARGLATEWIAQYPNHPLLPDAYLLRGDARSGERDYYKALYDYEYVIRVFPASPQFHTALQREYEIARLYVNGLNRKFLGLPVLPAEGEGEELLIRIQERAPGTELGEKAMLTLADHYFDKAQMELAAEAYDLFIANYPQSDNREWAMLRLIQASLARFRGPAYDPTGLIEASQRLKMYQEEYPAAAERLGSDALLVRIDESLALKEIVNARWYERRNEPVSAAYLYERVVQRYPQTGAAQIAQDRLEALDVDPSQLPPHPAP